MGKTTGAEAVSRYEDSSSTLSRLPVQQRLLLLQGLLSLMEAVVVVLRRLKYQEFCRLPCLDRDQVHSSRPRPSGGKSGPD